MMIALYEVSLARRLSNVSCEMVSGQCHDILGPNGAGKSSLLQIVAGLVAADSGKIVIAGRSISIYSLAELASIRCYHNQHNEQAFSLTGGELIRFYAANRSIPDALQQALEVNKLLDSPMNQLSGGEQQRVHLCRSLMQVWPAVNAGKALIVLDEPLSGLDIRHQYHFLTLTQRLAKKGNTLIMTSHDLSLSARFADNIVLMKNSEIIQRGMTREVMTAEHLENAFNVPFMVSNTTNTVEIYAGIPTV